MWQIKWHLLFPVLISITIFLIYSISLDNPFYWDDEELITNNYVLRTPLNFKNYFIANPIPQRPVTTLSFVIDYSLFGLKPVGFHMTQIVLHIVNTILIFFIANLILDKKWLVFLATFLFAFHPVHTEAVNLFLGRVDLFF